MARILVVEDDPTVAKILEIALARAGYGFQLARDYASAKLALGQEWDAILLDLNLPGGSGLELLRHLRKELGSPTPVIVLSGLKQEGTAKEALALGAQEYLTKPFSPLELFQRLRSYTTPV